MSPTHCQTGRHIYCPFLCDGKGANMIITISRETGSGGHTVGKMLAERLGYDFYDKEIITEIAIEMNVDEKLI